MIEESVTISPPKCFTRCVLATQPQENLLNQQHSASFPVLHHLRENAQKRYTFPSSKPNQDECDLQTLSEKEKEALFQYTIIVARYTTKLIKILNIFTSIAEEYSGQESICVHGIPL